MRTYLPLMVVSLLVAGCSPEGARTDAAGGDARREEPASHRGQAPDAQPVPGPGAYSSVDLTVERPSGVLAATLTWPSEGCPCPAAVLIPGVGAHDRDYTLWGHARFRVLAEYLAGIGIATLRYDERGVGGSTADPAGRTSADYAGDVRALVEALGSRPDVVDAERIGLIGHSEGGTIASLAAAESDDVAFVVMLASPGLPGRAYNLQYEESMSRAMDLGEAAIAERRAFQARVLDALLETPDSANAAVRLRSLYAESMPDVPPEQLERGIRRLTSPWFRFSLAHDPAGTLRNVKVPVLAVFGELDLQVPPAGNREALESALDVAAGVNRVVVLPRLNHFLQTAETGAPEEYTRLEEALAPAALELIGTWIRAHAGPRPAGS